LIKGKLLAEPIKGAFQAFSASGPDVWRNDFSYEGDAIIVSAVGARCGKSFRASGRWSAIANTHIVWPEVEAVDVDFLFRILNDEDFWVKGGTAQPFVKVRNTFERLVALPPLTEQRRIVAKLDALTARLARARAKARRIHELADKLRRGTLRQAFAGALTHSQSHADESGNAALPEGWTLQELGQISDIQGGIQVGKKRQGAEPLIETAYLRVANVQRGWLKLDEIKTIGVTADERARLLLHPGDIMMNEGGDRDKLGRGWVWRGQVADCIHQNHVFRIRLHDREFPPEFISHYANEFGQQYFIDEGTQTTNLASISKRKVAALPVPLPPTEEARRIIELITEAFARADRLEAEARKVLALIDRLEAAILAKAFRGELVPQDPNDEPASVLLERIRARRDAEPKAKRGRRPKLAS
jgi:type I restriction enzyme S subunit